MGTVGLVGRPAGSSSGLRALMAAGVVFAIAATVLAVFVTDVGWLRLAVLLGVWAALFAALALARARRDARAAQTEADEARLTYQLELQRELLSGREQEAEIAAEARATADRQYRDDLAGLREQVDRLNSMLSTLLDGEILVEKLTLSAQSTRIFSVTADRAGIEAAAPVGADVALDPSAMADHAGTVVEVDPAVGAGAGEAVPAGGPAHSSGVSVAELLAGFGGVQSKSRRRRRLAE